MRRLIIVFLMLPAVSLAAEMQAGFPSEAIWVSKTSAMAGDTLVVSAVVYNGDTNLLRGTIIFSADGERIGAREFELPTGGSQIHSIEWRPIAGEHIIAAAIEGTSASLSKTATSPITVTISEPPPPSAAQQTVAHISQTAASFASSSIPAVLGAAKGVFNAIEPYRRDGAERLEKYLEETRADKSNVTLGAVAGTSTSNVGGFATNASGDSDLISRATQAAATAALFVVGSLYIFYPLLAILFLGTLYLLSKRIRRRSV